MGLKFLDLGAGVAERIRPVHRAHRRLKPMRRTIEDVLVEAGLIDEARLRHVRRYARHNGVCLARAAVEIGGIAEELLAATMARARCGCRASIWRARAVDEDAVREVSHDLAEARRLLPLGDRPLGRAPGDSRGHGRSARLRRHRRDRDVDRLHRRAAGRRASARSATRCQRYYRGVITKMIPRRPVFGVGVADGTPAAGQPDPTTQPHHNVADEAPPELALEALVDLLVERGLIDREVWQEAVRRLIKETRRRIALRGASCYNAGMRRLRMRGVAAAALLLAGRVGSRCRRRAQRVAALVSRRFDPPARRSCAIAFMRR